MGSAIKEFLIQFIASTLGSFDSMVVSAQSVLTGDNMKIWHHVLTLSSILKPFCYSIIAICVLIELANVASKVDLLKWEHGLKVSVKMVFAKLCIDYAPQFLLACYQQSVVWIKELATSGVNVQLGDLISTKAQTQLRDVTGLGSIFGLFTSLMLVIMAIKICGFLLQVIAYGRVFEILIYLAVSPLPCAFFPLGDGSSGGFSRITGKFFRNFAAVCLQGVMMIICIRIFNMIIGTAFDSLIAQATLGEDSMVKVTNLCYTMLLGAIILLGSVLKCGSWARNILDV